MAEQKSGALAVGLPGNRAAPQAPAQAAGSMRELMPFTAALVDWLRALHQQLGGSRASADRIVAAGRNGKGNFYSAEIGPDGVFREFGSTPDGRRAVRVGGEVVMARRGGADGQD